jgi:hypothetical protein
LRAKQNQQRAEEPGQPQILIALVAHLGASSSPWAATAVAPRRDAVGHLTASLALTGQWQSGLPRDAFRHVPADGPWNGMTLLRDQAE